MKSPETSSGSDTVPSAPGHRDHPALTVDVVTIAWRQGRPQVLLIRRRKPPFAGCWAIPGGFVEPHEPLEAAARRELREETAATPRRLEQLHTFGDPGRDPRGWTVSVAYLVLLDVDEAEAQPLRAGSDAAEVGWFDLDDPPPLAFDHAEILACAAHRIREGRTSPGNRGRHYGDQGTPATRWTQAEDTE